jgi:hypothetical protein
MNICYWYRRIKANSGIIIECMRVCCASFFMQNMGLIKIAAAVGAGATGGGGAALAAVPAAVSVLGFKAGGIAAGSFAASMMSWMAPTAAGGAVATMQSIGVVGLGVAGGAVVIGVGAVGGAAAIGGAIAVGLI